MSDSETDFTTVQNQKSKNTKAKTTKRKLETSTATTQRSKSSKKTLRADLFELEEEASHLLQARRSLLPSSLVSCVANGKVKRTVDLSGDFYIDFKVYHKDDAASTPPEERWKKTTVALKAQLSKETPQWDALQIFMRKVHELFEDAEPVYFSDKINFK